MDRINTIVMNKIQFINKIIGKEWVFRQADFNGADCFGLVILYYKEVLGLDIPCSGYLNLTKEKAFYHDMNFYKQIDKPQENCIALMYHSDNPIHVGIVIDDGILHSKENTGVRYDDHLLIKRAYSKIEYYTYEK